MSISFKVFSAALISVALSHLGAAQATPVSYVATPSTYFGPMTTQISNSPYARFGNQDWSWKQAAYAGSFNSAVLTIGAYDVDPTEIDKIYAYDANSTGGSWLLLGQLTGANDAFSNTSFTLGSNFFDDIATGLMLRIDIDALNAGWATSLTNSVLNLTSATANSVPEPGSLALMGLGLAGLVAVRKRKRV